MAEPQRLETRLDRLWAEWIEFRDIAVKSGDMQDGIAAGKAWSRWLAEFVPDRGIRQAVHGAGQSQE
ncbi:hypothetical protein [Rhodopseudomonas sp. RCAM05734]|uniref:hypothetical protein n=1 Tax=Rhodopseudomonas sp. RCAM05734 TaxID=3457549 RepID=UPI004044A966